MAKLRTHIPVEEAIQRHEAGESLRSLARAYGVHPDTLARHVRRSGGKVRHRADATALANSQREHGPSRAKGFNEYNRTLEHKKRDIVRAYRNERGCEECGEKHPAVLDLHHRSETSKTPKLTARRADGTLKRGGGWRKLSFSDIQTELEKCIVLCSNCHRIRTAEARAREVDSIRGHLAPDRTASSG